MPLERFQAKWIPVRVKKTRQNKKIEPRSDSIGTEKALEFPTQPYGLRRLSIKMYTLIRKTQAGIITKLHPM